MGVGAAFCVSHFITTFLLAAYMGNADEVEDPGSLMTAISSLLIELSIPVCGYSGALYANRQLTCCFCSCSLFTTIVSIFSFIRLGLSLREVEWRCEREQSLQKHQSCETWVINSVETYVMILSLVVVIVIGSPAFWFGNILYNRLCAMHPQYFIVPPVVGEVMPLSSIPDTTVLSGLGRLLGAPEAGAQGEQLARQQEEGSPVSAGQQTHGSTVTVTTEGSETSFTATGVPATSQSRDLLEATGTAVEPLDGPTRS